MFDLLVLWTVWFFSVVILLAGLFRLNSLPPGGTLLLHLKKFQYLVMLAGALCIALSPIYGWSWSIYGGHLIAVSTGLMVLTRMMVAFLTHSRLTLDGIFDVLE